MQIDPVDSKNGFRITVSFKMPKFFLVISINFLVSRNFFVKSLIKLRCFETYSDSKAIFGIYRVDLHNRILISTWFDDLHFSASNTVEAVAKMA